MASPSPQRPQAPPAARNIIALLAEAGLPPKPVDPEGRPVSWLWVTGEPGFVYEGQEIAVDAAWIDARVDAWRSLTSRGYRVPVLREHRRDGEREGDVLTLARANVRGAESLIAACAWTDPAMPSKIAAGRVRYTSPGLADLTDDTGATHALVLTELSIVAAPHQKGAPTHILAAEAPTMPDMLTPPAERSVEDRLGTLETGLAELKAAQAEILAALAKLTPPATAAEPDPATAPPAPPAEPEMKMSEALKTALAVNAQLKARLDAAEFASACPSGAALPLDAPEVRAILLAEYARNPAAVKVALGKATKPAAAPPAAPAPAWGIKGNGIQASEMPGTGFQLSEDTSDEAIDAEARRIGNGDAKKELEAFQNLIYLREVARSKSKGVTR